VRAITISLGCNWGVIHGRRARWGLILTEQRAIVPVLEPAGSHSDQQNNHYNRQNKQQQHDQPAKSKHHHFKPPRSFQVILLSTIWLQKSALMPLDIGKIAHIKDPSKL
jgi:hypothetical protein